MNGSHAVPMREHGAWTMVLGAWPWNIHGWARRALAALTSYERRLQLLFWQLVASDVRSCCSGHHAPVIMLPHSARLASTALVKSAHAAMACEMPSALRNASSITCQVSRCESKPPWLTNFWRQPPPITHEGQPDEGSAE